MSKTNQKEMPGAATEFRFTIELPAAASRAWTALVKEVNAWWPGDFHAAGETSRMILEPKLGGRLYEDAGDGNGVLWYQVIALDAPRSITFSGAIAPPFGGPATTLLRLSLEEISAKTTALEIHDSLFGHIEGCDAQAGWRQVFGSLATYLKEK